MAHVGTAHALADHQNVRYQIATLLKKSIKRTIVLLGFLAVWELAPRLGLASPVFLPPLSEVVVAWWHMALSGELATHITASLGRSFTGYALAILYAIPLGLAIGWYKGLSEIVNPLLEILRNTAALALLPVFILLLGIGESSKIAVVIFACSWPILLNTISGVQNVDPLLIKSAQSLCLSPAQLFRKVMLPASLPSIFVGARLAGASSILVLVAAEMIGAKAGLGYLIIYSQYNFVVPKMYAGIITISIIGLMLNQTLLQFEKIFTGWKPVH
jgi:NitT/TauT family transport system permease protein